LLKKTLPVLFTCHTPVGQRLRRRCSSLAPGTPTIT